MEYMVIPTDTTLEAVPFQGRKSNPPDTLAGGLGFRRQPFGLKRVFPLTTGG